MLIVKSTPKGGYCARFPKDSVLTKLCEAMKIKVVKNLRTSTVSIFVVYFPPEKAIYSIPNIVL